MLIALHVIVILLALVGIAHLWTLPRFLKGKSFDDQILLVIGAAVTGIIIGWPYMMFVIVPLIKAGLE